MTLEGTGAGVLQPELPRARGRGLKRNNIPPLAVLRRVGEPVQQRAAAASSKASLL